jgi:hypothetical protein
MTTSAMVFYNKNTGMAWIARPDNTVDVIGEKLRSQKAVFAVMAGIGLIRTGDFLPAYGPVKSCTVR